MKSSAGRCARSLFVLVFFAFVPPSVGCKKRSAEGYVYSVFVDEGIAKAEGLELEGKPLTVFKQHPRGKSFEITLPAKELMVERKASVVMTTTCGATKLSGKVTVGITKTDTRAGEEYERNLLGKGKNDLTATFVLATPLRLADVYVDVDGAPGTPVTVGATTVDPKENPHRLPLGTCPTSDEVKVGGVSVGKLNVTPRKLSGMPDAPGTAFVDAKGGHCYEKKLHSYMENDVNTENMARSAPERLDTKRVYALDIDDFLKPSPETVTSKDTFPMRTEIRRCAAPTAAATGARPKPRPKTKK